MPSACSFLKVLHFVWVTPLSALFLHQCVLLSVCTVESSTTTYLSDYQGPACRLSSCITSLTSRMTHLLRFKMPFVNQLMLTAPKFVSVAWTSPLNSIHMSNNSLGFYTWSKRYLKINMSRTILLSPLELLPTLFISVTGNFCSFNCSGQKL